MPAVYAIYESVHQAEENGQLTCGWKRNIYPVPQTARDAHQKGELFVLESGDRVLATAIINQQQVDVYAHGAWQYSAFPHEVMVLHTLAVDPNFSGQGMGGAFMDFYSQYARDNGCAYLRMDTNAKNTRARNFYKKLGFLEVGIVPTNFNGLPGVELVLLEKKLDR